MDIPIMIKINDSDNNFCDYSCPFKNDLSDLDMDLAECLLFKQDLESYISCGVLQEWFRCKNCLVLEMNSEKEPALQTGKDRE